ncbi:hypothetical protein L6164_006468 [Bauhinia variegata]|uniref:Uncharacterized protein n=1 Tax=Bauhinia variegata TaxID=167791 RepID=A0ACB9PVY4_BAUVA|nr:hypothetical protein L6164_006468 [Bauhinia variegata]
MLSYSSLFPYEVLKLLVDDEMKLKIFMRIFFILSCGINDESDETDEQEIENEDMNPSRICIYGFPLLERGFLNRFEISSYVKLLDMLIDHPEDVKELRECKSGGHSFRLWQSTPDSVNITSVRMVAKRKILNSATVSPKKPELDRDSDLRTQLPVTPASKTKALSSSRLKSIFLHDWWLVKAQAEGLAVGGVASTETLGERVFCSTVITKRHETNVLETKDGITVVLSGFINRSRTYQNGFPLEICDDFLFGFPHNWEEYTAKGFGEHTNVANGFGDSNTCSQKQAAFSIDGDLTYCWLPSNICNDLVKWQGNVSEVSELIDTMERNNTMNTTECIPKEDNKILKRTQPEENQMHNGENEICNDPRKRQGNVSQQSEPTDTIEHNNAVKTTDCIHKEDVRTLKGSQPKDNQVHNVENGVLSVTNTRRDKSGCQTVMNRNSTTPCGEHSVSGCRTPISTTEEKKSVGEKKPLEDVGDSCRRVTRSISKRSQKTMPIASKEIKVKCVRTPLPIASKEIKVKCVRTPVPIASKEIKVNCVRAPVRRSARLCNLRK